MDGQNESYARARLVDLANRHPKYRRLIDVLADAIEAGDEVGPAAMVLFENR